MVPKGWVRTPNAAAGPTDTVTTIDAETVPLVAVIVAVPTFAATTTPAVTLATLASVELYATVAVGTTRPSGARTVAVSVTSEPATSAIGPGGARVMLAGVSSSVTVTWDVELKPPDDAVIVAVPADTPVTPPADDTVATLGAELLHAITALATIAPLLSLAVAASDSVAPTFTVVELEAIWTDETTPAPGGSEGPGVPEPPQANRDAAAQITNIARRVTGARVTVGRQGWAYKTNNARLRWAMASR